MDGEKILILISKGIGLHYLTEWLEFKDEMVECFPESADDLNAMFDIMDEVINNQGNILKKNYEDCIKD